MKGRFMSLADFQSIQLQLSKAALYEQLAEECVELAHACQKKARLLRGENPTPLTKSDIDAMVDEEYTDVCLVAHLLYLHVDNKIYRSKLERWAERLS